MARRSERSHISTDPLGTAHYSSIEPTRVMAVANGQRFIEKISGLLAGEERVNFMGGAQDRVMAAERLMLLKPDVVVIDANLDYELGGIDTAFALRAISPATAFVLISPYSDPERLAMVPRGLGLEWSYLYAPESIDTVDQRDLVSAISSASWSIPFIDRRIDRSKLGVLQNRVERAVENVLRISQKAKDAPSRQGKGYASSADWHGKVKKFRLPDDLLNGGEREGE